MTPALYFRVALVIAFSYADAEKLCWQPESAVSSISRGATCSMPVKNGEDRIVCRSADSVNKAAVFALFLESSESRPRRGRGVTAAATRAPAATGAPLVAMFDDSAFAAGGAASAFEVFFGGIVAAASAVRLSRKRTGLGSAQARVLASRKRRPAGRRRQLEARARRCGGLGWLAVSARSWRRASLASRYR